jgi:fatty acid desaturase
MVLLSPSAARRAPSGKERRSSPPAMIPDPEVEASVRRIRRGCLFSAMIIVALSVLFVSATGNLFYLSLLLVALALVALSRAVR